jgi:8-oxo-dGTP pyrophosphatase MutT (NUDIX family)
MHSVYVNDKPLIFDEVYEKKTGGDKYRIYSREEKSIDDVMFELTSKQVDGIVYLSSDPGEAWKEFVSKHTLVETSGGLVQNEKGKYLIIFRKGRWDLPKGKIEYDETVEEAAIREVMEECGIKKLTLVRPIGPSFHTYLESGKRILKKTHWFLMSAPSDVPLFPQKEEGIEEAEWMSKEEIARRVIPETYSSVSQLLRNFFDVKGAPAGERKR